MRVLFHVSLTTMLRHFEDVLRSLADRGHTVRIAATGRSSDLPIPPALASHGNITFVTCDDGRHDVWADRILELRALRDYMRYLDDRFGKSPKLRARAARKLADTVSHGAQGHLVARCPRCQARLVDDEVGRMLLGFGQKGTGNLASLLALVEDTIPSDAGIEAFLRQERPDVFMVTPLVKIGSRQPDYVKSARALGVPVAFPVFSWDNLSTKGLIHVIPDRVLVWNARQRNEAIEMHGVPPERVVVTGAPRFDGFFAMQPQMSREQFCAAHGFDHGQPIVMYLCSSEFVAYNPGLEQGREVHFVRRWIDEVRQAPALASCNILIRPHPREREQWRGFEAPARVTVSLPQGMNADHSLFEGLYHSAVAVGLNTSAQLEAGIVGRPVLTVLAPEFAEGQRGTLHFGYLLKEQGGFVELAPDMETHRQQLASAAAGEYDAQGIQKFVERFLRPHGLDRPAAEIMVEAIEALAVTS